MSQNINPYEAPQADESEIEVALETPMRVRWQYPWIGAGVVVFIKVILLGLVDGAWLGTPLYVFGNLYQVANLAIGGMGVGIVVDALRQGKFSKLMPGHWVMMLVFAMFTSQLIGELWTQFEANSLGNSRSTSWYWITLVVDNSMTALFFMPVVWMTIEPLRWKIFAWLSFIVALMTLIQFPLIPFMGNPFVNPIVGLSHASRSIGESGLIVALILLVIIEYAFDKARVKTRDGYHWLGIYGPFLLVLILAAMAGAFF